MKKERLETLNDAVIAIIVTLMVLEIKLPELTTHNLGLLAQHVMVYALSFFIVTIGWINISLLYASVDQVNANTVWLNVLLLFFISLIPLPTEAIGTDFFDPKAHVFYGLVLTVISLVFRLFQKNLFQSGNQSFPRMESRTNLLVTGLYASSMGLCFISVYLSMLTFLIPPVIYFIVSKKRHEQQLRQNDFPEQF